jgi:hypothetical protein
MAIMMVSCVFGYEKSNIDNIICIISRKENMQEPKSASWVRLVEVK